MLRFLGIFILTLGLGSFSANATDLPFPKGPVILKITGQVLLKNTGDGVEFDIPLLESIDQTTLKTHTPWHKGEVEFEGVSGKKLLQTLGVVNSDKMLRVVALNDYAVDVPIRDFFETGLILAMKKDGKYMRVRDKGPLFIIYPYSHNKELDNGTYYARSVWQIKSIHVK